MILHVLLIAWCSNLFRVHTTSPGNDTSYQQRALTILSLLCKKSLTQELYVKNVGK